MTASAPISIAFIGFGEAAQAFVTGWQRSDPPVISGHRIAAYDIKTDDPGEPRDRKLAEYRTAGIAGREIVADAVAGADAVFSLVTADQALVAARTTAGLLPAGTLYFDCNSCAPQTKGEAAAAIEASGGRYVDVAVMAPVHPRLHATPVLVSGPHAEAARDAMRSLRMSAETVDGGVGRASAIKLVRSIMIKGLEALTVECLLAGRKLGVDDPVLRSLDASFPGFDWTGRASHMLERVMQHGLRRAAEMREAAAMLEKAGLPGRMARATVNWQQQIGELDVEPADRKYVARVEALLKAMDASPIDNDVGPINPPAA